ncbi:MAG: thioredoxin domain-containing protein [Candidatus Rokubacteria bacterium]|nr:thioredoxin domain-containing protein [Candidatus Rokubacteria bacterium]
MARRLVAGLVLFQVLAAPAGAQAPARSEAPLAQVDGQAITAEEVEKALGPQLNRLHEQIYALKRQKVEALINERLLAKEAARHGVSVPALLDAEVTSKVGLVTEQELERVYQANKARLRGDEAEAREQIRAHLQNQKLQTRREAFLRTLRAQAKVVVNVPRPPVFRAEVPTDGAPFKGPAEAPVTIVEFQDFHCPFCKRVQPTVAEILARYGDKVKVVHKDFPIDQLHPQARKGHEAARCANEQGKFWAYHDKLYENAPKASPEQLKAFAQEVGLAVPAFEQCLASGKHRAAVQRDVEEGQRLGVTGTPTFFINGRLLSGAQPFESFARMIDEELERQR